MGKVRLVFFSIQLNRISNLTIVKEKYSNGLEFKGGYKNNQKNGCGEISYPNGDRVEGNFENNFLEG